MSEKEEISKLKEGLDYYIILATCLKEENERLKLSLEKAGFEDRGGEIWAPPVNKDAFAPKYFKLEEENKRLREALENKYPRCCKCKLSISERSIICRSCEMKRLKKVEE